MIQQWCRRGPIARCSIALHVALALAALAGCTPLRDDARDAADVTADRADVALDRTRVDAPSDGCRADAGCADGPPPDVIRCADVDGDGHPAESCGGDDCDDARGTVFPGAMEACNAIDDDCDGMTDEGNPGGGSSCSTALLGLCQAGTMQCVAGGLACVQTNTARAESCNGVDDDCDGMTDEGNPGAGAACSTTLPGLCRAGTLQCRTGQLACVQTNTARAESCNGVDDDCDGATDDAASCGSPSGSVCSAGSCVCPSGQSNCSGSCQPTGAGCTVGIGPCQRSGSIVCSGTGTACSASPGPSSGEVCNGVDDNCDGAVDNGIGNRSCSQCSGWPGTESCGGGRWNCGLNGSWTPSLASGVYGHSCGYASGSAWYVPTEADTNCTPLNFIGTLPAGTYRVAVTLLGANVGFPSGVWIDVTIGSVAVATDRNIAAMGSVTFTGTVSVGQCGGAQVVVGYRGGTYTQELWVQSVTFTRI